MNITNFSSFFIKSTTWVFKLADMLSLIFFLGSWIKLRVIYYVNNWVYSTNHKRIAVNYFWFVILAGIVGMVLATIIRLELAYPGVGIFAGDSLQYLSMVTAHGVIMVFFMIMPLLAGAFGNFLLPTQLGVHDVAFPRLNSAAFWFLPAGLIMLANLVCVDRRYQRMNCFNIREVQSLLKKKFFVDLVDPHEFGVLLDSSMIGIKYKLNNINYLNPNTLLNYKWGLTPNQSSRSPKFKSLATSHLTSNVLNSQLFKEVHRWHNLQPHFHLWSYYLYSANLLSYIPPFRESRSFLSNFSVIFTSGSLNFSYKITPFVVVNVLMSFFKTTFSSLFSAIKIIFNGALSTLKPVYEEVTYWIHQIDLFEKDPLHPRSWYFWWVWLTEIKLHFLIVRTKQWVAIRWHRLLTKLYTYCSTGYFFPQIYDTKNYSTQSIFQSLVKIFNWNNFNRFSVINKPTPQYLELIKNSFFEKLTIDNYEFTVKTLKTQFPKLSFFQLMEFQWLVENLNNSTSSTPFSTNRQEFSKNYNVYVILTNFNITFFAICSIPLYLWNIINNIYNFQIISTQISNFCYYLTHWILTTFFDINFVVIFTPMLYTEFLYTSFCYYWNNALRILFWWVRGTLKLCFNDIHLCLHACVSFVSIIWNQFPSFSFNFKTVNLSNYITHFLQLVYLPDLNLDLNLLNVKKYFFKPHFQTQLNLNTTVSVLETTQISHKINQLFNENLSNQRYTRFTDPIFKYDYKSGDYFPKLYKEVYKHLFVSVMNITNGLKTSPWFRHSNVNDIIDFLNEPLIAKKTKQYAINLINEKINNIFIYYSIFFSSAYDANFRWISELSLNQKFYNMFLTSSLQQRIYNNWRQLKFTREAWRCKMLAARHQKTLFRRYVHEDGVFWSIERNAKDLLPGWAMITPFSSRVRFTAIGKVDIGLMGVLLVLNSSIISGANFLVTYRYLSTLNNRKMRDARAFFAEGVMVTSWMMILANPMLVIGIIMLLSDRHWQTSFFDYSGGGDTVLFQHMFWFFGHPEVYIIMIPVFGFVNTILSYYLRKRVSARASLIYSMYTIAFLGFFVWGHHMYMVGLAHTTRMLFSTLTVMISVPAATKLMHWCVTIVNSAFVIELPFLFVLTFIFFFVSGGISGMYVAHTGMDILFHDTFYVIGHFHVMFAGAAMFGSFGAFYFYFPAIFGVKYSRIYAYLHYTYYLIGQLMTVIPMFWLGYAGMPRRVLDYPASLGGWHSVISAGHMLSVAGLIAFFIMIFDSIRQGKAVIRNTYGISRFNTRLSFYLYESSRLIHVQRRNLFLFKSTEIINLKLNNLNFTNYEHLESTLLSYTIYKKKF